MTSSASRGDQGTENAGAKSDRRPSGPRSIAFSDFDDQRVSGPKADPYIDRWWNETRKQSPALARIREIDADWPAAERLQRRLDRTAG